MTRTSRRRGLLVAVEGIDGTGKSTLVRALAATLRREGRSVAMRKEPFDRRLGRARAGGERPRPVDGRGLLHGGSASRPARARARSRAPTGRDSPTVRTSQRWLTREAPCRRRTAPGSSGSNREPRSPRTGCCSSTSIRPKRGAVSPGARLTGHRSSAARTLERVARSYRLLARRPGWTRLDARLPTPALVAEAVRALRLRPARRAVRAGARRR